MVLCVDFYRNYPCKNKYLQVMIIHVETLIFTIQIQERMMSLIILFLNFFPGMGLCLLPIWVDCSFSILLCFCLFIATDGHSLNYCGCFFLYTQILCFSLLKTTRCFRTVIYICILDDCTINLIKKTSFCSASHSQPHIF